MGQGDQFLRRAAAISFNGPVDGIQLFYPVVGKQDTTLRRHLPDARMKEVVPQRLHVFVTAALIHLVNALDHRSIRKRIDAVLEQASLGSA